MEWLETSMHLCRADGAKHVMKKSWITQDIDGGEQLNPRSTEYLTGKLQVRCRVPED